MQRSDEKGKIVSVEMVIPLVQGTEYTQRGNGRFLAYSYIPSWWKNYIGQAGEGGGARPASIYHHVKSGSVRSSWEGRYTPPISLLILCALWYLFYPQWGEGAHFPCPCHWWKKGWVSIVRAHICRMICSNLGPEDAVLRNSDEEKYCTSGENSQEKYSSDQTNI